MAADESSSSDLGEYSYLPILFKHLKRILDDNIEYFERDTSKAVYKKFYDGFKLMTTTVHTMEEVVQVIAKAAPLYDFSIDIKGNGYRSLITIVEHSIRSVTDLAAYCQTHRDRFYFRWHHYSMEVEAFANLFCRIAELLELAKSLINDNVPNHLFHEHFDSDLLIAAEQLDRECFYGRTLGFQVSCINLFHIRTLSQFRQCINRTLSIYKFLERSRESVKSSINQQTMREGRECHFIIMSLVS